MLDKNLLMLIPSKVHLKHGCCWCRHF